MNKPQNDAVLTKVRTAVNNGDKATARTLLQQVLKDNPRNVMAWGWACQAAETDSERIACLRQMLKIDPDHQAARSYLAQIQAAGPVQSTLTAAPPQIQAVEPVLPTPASAPPQVQAAGPVLPTPAAAPLRRRPGERLLALLYGLSELPAGCLIGAAGALILVVAVVYMTVNLDWFGLAEPEWDKLAISPGVETIRGAEQTWKIIYERTADTQFVGLVRHASLIRYKRVPFLTHDILVTSGDFADPELVRTSVVSHHFTWRSRSLAHPEGMINLLHTVAVSPEIYRQLLQVRQEDQVIIIGREILSIQVYDQKGTYLGDWHDTGCNTLLVHSVEILPDTQKEN